MSHLVIGGAWFLPDVRHDILFFDKVFLIRPPDGWPAIDPEKNAQKLAEIEYLEERGIVEWLDFRLSAEEEPLLESFKLGDTNLPDTIDGWYGEYFPRTRADISRFYKTASLHEPVYLIEGTELEVIPPVLETKANFESFSHILARYAASHFRRNSAVKAVYRPSGGRVSLSVRDLPEFGGKITRSSIDPYFKEVECEIASVALKKVPLPSGHVPLQSIVEFRDDEDAMGKLKGLRYWVQQQMSRGERPLAEIDEELEWDLHQLEKRLRAHKLRMDRHTISTLVTSGVDFVSNLARMDFGGAAKSLFSVERRQETVLDFEANVAGAELLYLVKAKETLGRQ